MFKRLAAVLLAGVMVLAMLTACGGSNATERKFIDAINKGTANAHYTNNADLQSKVRSVLSKVDDNGMIKVADLPYIGEGEDKEYGYSDYKVDEKTDDMSFVIYVITMDDLDKLNGKTEVEALEMTAEAQAKLDSGNGLDLNKELDSTQDITSMVKEIGVATYTKNGKTYVGFALSFSGPMGD